VVAVPVAADGPERRWVYHRIIIELVATSTKVSMDRVWNA
jgi:hypothetical protein